MKSSSQIQQAHEDAVLRDALAEHNRLHGLALAVVSRPDPPDAILSDGVTTTWMELTDAFFSQAWARDLSSYGSIKDHKPMASGGYVDMDRLFAENFVIWFNKRPASSLTPPSSQVMVQEFWLLASNHPGSTAIRWTKCLMSGPPEALQISPEPSPLFTSGIGGRGATSSFRGRAEIKYG